MPKNAFIQFIKDGQTVPGESQQAGHLGKDGWSPITDFSWKAEHPHSVMVGGGAALSQAKSGELSFSHVYDKSASLLMQGIATGVHFGRVTINMLKQMGTATPVLYFQLTVQDAFITKVETKGTEDGSATQDIEFVFRQIVVGYKRQLDSGKLQTPMYFRWNVIAGNHVSNITPTIS